MSHGNLLIRTVAAVVLLPPVAGLVWGGGWWSAALFSFAAAAATFEFYRLAFGRLVPEVVAGVAAAAALPLLPVLVGPGTAAAAFWVMAALSAAAWGYHAVRAEVSEGPEHSAQVVAGVLFCAVGPFALSELRQGPHGLQWVALVLSATWTADTAAYFAGRAFGRHKLAPEVSPKKSWEGYAAGVAGAMAAALAAGATYFRDLEAGPALLCGALMGLVGPLGDLSKSVLKRAHGRKDAGRLIPGHGGMLDRIDALLFNAPMILGFAALSGQ